MLKNETAPLLEVQNLKEFFKINHNDKVKAVHGVSFKIYPGETYGLVGESGSGKSTIGRSIIRLYDITSGNVYFDGIRISAGTRWNEKEIKFTKIRTNKKVKELTSEMNKEIKEVKTEHANDKELSNKYIEEIKAKYKPQIEEAKKYCKEVVDREKGNIRSAKYDNKHFEEAYTKKLVTEIDEKYKPIFAEAKTEAKQKKAKEAYSKEVEKAKKTKLMPQMQMIFQDPMASLNPRKKVEDIVAEGLDIHHMYSSLTERRDIVLKWLKKVGLSVEQANRYPHQFSGGQRQRVGITRALVMNPKLIIADECISALDVSIQAQVVNLMKDIQEETGVAYLFIAHDLSMVKYISDRIGVLHLGYLVETGTTEEIFNNPIHPYTKSLLSAIPTPNPEVEKTKVPLFYDYATSNIDYRKGSEHLISGTHYVLGTDEEIKKWQKK